MDVKFKFGIGERVIVFGEKNRFPIAGIVDLVSHNKDGKKFYTCKSSSDFFHFDEDNENVFSLDPLLEKAENYDKMYHSHKELLQSNVRLIENNKLLEKRLVFFEAMSKPSKNAKRKK